MLSNPPLNYGPELGGAASADPVETENYEALLNLGTEAISPRLSVLIRCLLLPDRKMGLRSSATTTFHISFAQCLRSTNEGKVESLVVATVVVVPNELLLSSILHFNERILTFFFCINF